MIIAAILVGYFSLFRGASFLAEEDPVVLADYLHGNASLSGWRPDKALGMSFFFGDPGMFHAWAPLAFLERLVPSGHAAYSASIVVLLICAAIAQFYFLKRVAPGLGVAGALLAPVLVFSPIQHELYFQRHWIALAIGTPLLLMLLEDYFTRPRWTHVVWATLLFWFTMFFGSSRSFVCLVVVGLVFGVAYWSYHRPAAITVIAKQCGLYLTAFAGTLMLGAWVFYSMAVELRATSYDRAPLYSSWEEVNLSALAYLLVSPFHSGLIDAHIPSATLSTSWLTQSWTSVSPLFPLVFVLALARRQSGFWPWTLRWTLVAFLANELLYVVPGYAWVLQHLWPLFAFDKFQPAYHALQVGLIGCVLTDICAHAPEVNARGTGVVRRLAAALAVPYVALLVFATVACLAPGTIALLAVRAFDLVGPSHAAGFAKAVLHEAVRSNVLQVERSMSWSSICLYGLTAAVMVAVWRRPPSLLVRRRSLTLVAFVFLVEGFLLSWSLYPMYTRAMVWESASSSQLKPTDRVYLFFDPSIQAIERTVAGFRAEWVDGEFGPPVDRVGYRIPPALTVSSIVSFWPHDTATFIRDAFRKAGTPLTQLRDLYFGPFVKSDLLDMAAVTHYASFRPLPASAGMQLAFKEQQLYVYRSPSAWPYFYLADTLQIAGDPADVQTPTRGTAYVAADTFKGLPAVSGRSNIILREFSFGRLVFDFAGSAPEFLVVADAWHPAWKARANTEELRVVKANGVFKGVPLPAGQYTVTLFFDTSAYRPGIYVSAASWGLLALLCVGLKWRDRRTTLSPPVLT